MSWWQRLLRRSQMEMQLDKELRFHLDQYTSDLIAQGLDPEEARRQARIALGGPEQVKEECRDARGTRWLEDLLRDFRHAARRLRSNPGFATVAAVTLALGIGASTAIFSAVNPILFEPLPYPQAGRIMMIWDIFQGERSDLTFHTYREVAARNHSFDAIAVMDTWQPTLTGDTQPERLDGQVVSSEYFRVLGVSPVLGRDFQVSDDRFHGPRVAILSDALWRRRFGSDNTIVGRQVRLDDDLYTVVGVMPRSFENVLSPSSEVWSPLQYDSGNITNLESSEWGHHLKMAGRLRAGFGIDQTRRELTQIAQLPVPEFPRVRWAALKNGFIVDSLRDQVARGVKPALLAVLGAVILVLVIACVNVTNLLLARGAQRRGEFALRAALGAGRTRIARQLLTESLLLAFIGGILGIVVAELGVRGLVALSPPQLPRVSAIGVNGGAFAFAFAITTVIGLLVGLIPALHASQDDPQGGLIQASRRTTGGRQWTRRTLVVAEVALSLVLLVSAGLLLRSLKHIFAVAPGFQASHVLTMQVQTSGHQFDDHLVRRRFYDKALEGARNVPGVAVAAFTSMLPLSGQQNETYGAQFEDQRSYDIFRYAVTPGYFETMGIALRRGRLLDAHDVDGAPQAVVISESLATRQFGNRDPIGQRVHVGPMNRPWYTVVGVVSDVKQTSLAEIQPNAVYMTPAQSWFADEAMSLVARVRGDAAALAPAIRNAIWSVDKNQPIIRVATMDTLLAASEAERSFVLILFEVFGIVALLLAATGIYGVLSGSVNERMREIGVRSALGATRGDIVALVLRQAMMLTGLGVLIGLGGAVAASRALITLLFGVSHLDPITYSGVVALLLGVSMIACWVPAWRAARVDPSITLRAE
ncbi:MAG TPA: ABC transporter permease [Bryobacteraceae bacterium]|nr:ABC transporter permease [Bryobacteraceae bacterium]